MPPKRKRPASRPPEETTTSGPPARRAKTLAKDNISLQLTTEQDDRPTLTPSPSNDLDDDFASLEPKVEKQEPPEEPVDYSGGSNPDVCAICLAPRSDPTVLDNCTHSFCFTCTSQWLKYAGKCPLCLQKVERFWHHANLPPSERPVVIVAELRAAAEAERLAERGQSQPPLDEQECIRLRIRRLQRRLDYVQKQMNGNARVDRSSDLSKTNGRLVNEISKLEMLKRDVTTRGDLVGNIVFRSLIYKDKLEWSSIDRNSIRVPFSPEVFSANVAESTERLKSFLDRELQIVWRCRKPNETKEDYARGRSTVAREIITWCSEYQINSPQFSRNLRLIGIFPGYLERFQSELFEFASSMLSLRDFDRTSAYSSPELRQALHRRNRRGNGSQEVVMLSDSDSDSAVIPLDSGRTHARRNGDGDDVIVLSDNNPSDEEPTFPRGESNYVRDEATSSNSEASNAGDFYTRPACLLPQYPRPSRANPLHVVDAFGSARDLWQHLFTPFAFPADGRHNFFRAFNMPSSIDEQDTTIVLSSDDENDRSTTTGSRHSRRTTPLRSGQGNYSSSSQDTVTTNDIAWLTPAEHSNHSETPPHRSNSLLYRDGADLSPSSHLPSSVTDGNSRAQSNQRKSSEEVQILSDAPNSSNGVPLSSAAPSKPKSLFAPGCAKKLLPSEPVSVKGENKLLAALWQERRNRLAANGRASIDPSLSTSAGNEEQKDGITSMSPGNLNGQVDRSATNGDSTCSQQTQPGSSGGSVASGDSVELVDAPSTSSSVGKNVGTLAVKSSKDSRDERQKRRHDGKWESIFKRFRNKLQRERNLRKRERAYNFLIEMKQLEEDRRKRDSHHSRTTERRSRRTSSSSRESSLSRRGDRSGDEVGVERT